MERNRELLNERMQLSPRQGSALQAIRVLAHMANSYPHNVSPSPVMRSPMAHQFHAPEVRYVAMELSPDVTSVGLATGGSPRVDFGTVMSHLLVGATARSPRELLPKEMASENVVERANRKNGNPGRTIGVALTKRQ